MINYKQPWLHSAWLDGTFIILPPFLTLLAVAFMPAEMKDGKGMSVGMWVGLVLLVDVAHVYSTLYRTYLDKNMQQQHRSLLINIPLLAFIAGVLLYTIGAMVFWRVLAYIAVFHFVRQQYGFMRLYSRQQSHQPGYKTIIDSLAIYTATLYPILYWHCKGPRNFNWFVPGDFYYIESDLVITIGAVVFFAVLGTYIISEAIDNFRNKQFNLPKNLLMAGTYLSWYFGIIHFNGDVAFTALNVISHGIPYMALIWIYGRKQEHSEVQSSSLLKTVFSTYGVVLFLLFIFVLAFVEEGLWDAMVWNEHREVFSVFYFLPHVKTDVLLAFLVPLLTLPQVTHYVIDGFIWKVRSKH